MEYEINYNVLELTFDGLCRLNLIEEDKCLLGKGTVVKLETVDGKTPEELMGEQYLRDYAQDVLDCEQRGDFRIATAIELTLRRALKDFAKTSAPLRPPTDYELIAYVDGLQGGLMCDEEVENVEFTQGNTYAVRTEFFKYEESFTMDRPQYDEKRKTYVTKKHRIVRRGRDRAIIINDDDGSPIYFAEKPPLVTSQQTLPPDAEVHNLDLLWVVFERPDLPTVKEMMPLAYDHAIESLDAFELLSAFHYYTGQRDFIARMSCRDTGIIGAACGCGKSLMAITLMKLKLPEGGKILLMAPAATVTSGNAYSPAQWVDEFRNFAPEIQVFELFSEEDYRTILKRYGGRLPNGVYLTYPEALFMKNKSREFIPPTWLDSGKRTGWGKTSQRVIASAWDVEAKFRKEQKLPELNLDNLISEERYHKGVGEHCPISGISCVARASLATTVVSEQGDFDAIFLDEAHMVCANIQSQRGRAFLRLQAKFRYCMSATPIPNNIGDLFGIAGWVSIDRWFLGRKKSVQWPYSVDQRSAFESQYLTYDTDLTASIQKSIKYGKGGKQKKVVHRSHVLSQPTSLLKLLKPILGYVDKKDCRFDVPPLTDKSVRVPMGTEQQRVYDIVNKAGQSNPFTCMTSLRQLVSAPGAYGTPEFTPKVTTTLQLMLECLEKHEQVVIVSARHDMTNLLIDCIDQSGIPYTRLDGTMSNKMQSWNSMEFKHQKVPFMFMGIKCAVGHSYPKCCNLICTSLEWSYGTKEQAFGRVHRVNSERPVNIWCVLTLNSIEETIFDRVGQKEDSAVLCLHGKRVARTPQFSSPEDILAEHMIDYAATETIDEKICAAEWPTIKNRLMSAGKIWDPTLQII
jgi:hypothetical protein